MARPDFGRTTQFQALSRMGSSTQSFQQAVLIGPGRRGGARGHAQLGEDVAHVPIDGLLAQEELAAMTLLVLPDRDEQEHLELARAQAVRVRAWGRLRRARARRTAIASMRRYVGGGAELDEDLPRGLELERCAVFVAERLKRPSHDETDARAQVRSPDALPHFLRASQRIDRSTGVAFGQSHGALRVLRHRAEHLHPEAFCDRAQLVGGPPRLVEIGRGQHDLHVRRQEARALERIGRRREHAPRRGRGQVDATLGHAEQRHGPAADRGRAHWPARRPVRLRAARRAGDGARLPGRTRCPPRRPSLDESRTDARRASSTASGHAPPICMISERWMRHASGEGHELRLRLTPPAERSRPFARAIERVALLAGRDDAAVDQTGDERRELAARHRHHRLVEERQAFREPTVPDQRASLEAPAERAEVAVPVAVADLGSLRGSGAARPRDRRRP